MSVAKVRQLKSVVISMLRLVMFQPLNRYKWLGVSDWDSGSILLQFVLEEDLFILSR